MEWDGSRSVVLHLKNGKGLRVEQPRAENAEQLKSALDEIMAPEILRNPTALPFDRIATAGEELARSLGQNIRKMVDLILTQAICQVTAGLDQVPQQGVQRRGFTGAGRTGNQIQALLRHQPLAEHSL